MYWLIFILPAQAEIPLVSAWAQLVVILTAISIILGIYAVFNKQLHSRVSKEEFHKHEQLNSDQLKDIYDDIKSAELRAAESNKLLREETLVHIKSVDQKIEVFHKMGERIIELVVELNKKG